MKLELGLVMFVAVVAFGIMAWYRGWWDWWWRHRATKKVFKRYFKKHGKKEGDFNERYRG